MNDMDRLADEGWKQMHEILQQHGLSSDQTVGEGSGKKRIILFLLAACAILFVISSIFYLYNGSSKIPYSQPVNSSTVFSEKQPTVPAEKIAASEKNTTESLTPLQKHLIREKINSAFFKAKQDYNNQLSETEIKFLLQKLLLEKTEPVSLPFVDNHIDSTLPFEKVIKPSVKSGNQHSGKIQVFAGAGINISHPGNKVFNSLDDNFNIHPAITVVIPFSKKLSLHTGLSAFSTIHGKEVTAREKEVVNNISSNVFYNIKTTSLIKASYFDLPVTLHYGINDSWTIGAGVQLSKLNKVSIREEKESYDYNNTLNSATVDRYSASPMLAAAAFQKKLEIKKMEPRLIAETSLERGHFLFTAGYYYSLDKSIILKDSYNSSHQYRNEYFKLGIQYRIYGKGK